jgi:hypothetical protein
VSPENANGSGSTGAVADHQDLTEVESHRSGRVGGRVKMIHDVCPAIRRAVRRQREAGLDSAGDLALLLAVIDRVASWSRLIDRMRLDDLETDTGLTRDGLKRALRRNVGAGVLVYEPARGRGHVGLVGLPPAAKRETQESSLTAVEKGDSRAEKRETGGREKRASSRGRGISAEENASEKKPTEEGSVGRSESEPGGFATAIARLSPHSKQREEWASFCRDMPGAFFAWAGEADMNEAILTSRVRAARSKEAEVQAKRKASLPECPDCGTGAGQHWIECPRAAGREVAA